MGSNDNNHRIEMHVLLGLTKGVDGFTPKTLVEVGSRDGEDAHWIAEELGISYKKVHIIEPHPEMAENISKKFPYNVYPYALGQASGTTKFFAARDMEDGRSSILHREIYKDEGFDEIEVPVKSFSEFMEEAGLDYADVVKIDVEGAAYDVILGMLQPVWPALPCADKVRVIQIECENNMIWDNQKTYIEVKHLLESNGFILAWEHVVGSDQQQTDALFVNATYFGEVKEEEEND